MKRKFLTTPLTYFLAALLLSGCSTTKNYFSISPEDALPKNSSDKSSARFVIDLNDQVFQEIRKITRNRGSKQEFQAALQRMETYRSLIVSLLEKADLPIELIAVPFVQTGYMNRIPQFENDGAGIWRFTPFTANIYGLITDEQFNGPLTSATDDRMDPGKETEAAVAYLAQLFRMFHDWRLVLTAYCKGEAWVALALENHPTASPWDLEKPLSHDKSCLAQSMAVLYLFHHSEVLQ